jgi:hypothetical protein
VELQRGTSNIPSGFLTNVREDPGDDWLLTYGSITYRSTATTDIKGWRTTYGPIAGRTSYEIAIPAPFDFEGLPGFISYYGDEWAWLFKDSDFVLVQRKAFYSSNPVITRYQWTLANIADNTSQILLEQDLGEAPEPHIFFPGAPREYSYTQGNDSEYISTGHGVRIGDELVIPLICEVDDLVEFNLYTINLNDPVGPATRRPITGIQNTIYVDNSTLPGYSHFLQPTRTKKYILWITDFAVYVLNSTATEVVRQLETISDSDLRKTRNGRGFYLSETTLCAVMYTEEWDSGES